MILVGHWFNPKVLFAARLRKAKIKAHQEYEKLKERQGPEYLSFPPSSPVAPLSPDHPFAKDPKSQVKVCAVVLMER